MFFEHRILVSEREIVIKENAYAWFVGVGALLISMFRVKPLLDIQSTVGRIFITIWILSFWGMGAWALIHGSKKLKLNDEGILHTSWISSEFLPWGELEDYGLSYYGKTNKHLNTYRLYFSKQVHPIRNEYSKRLRGKMIKVDIVDKEYGIAVRSILPFCRQRTNAQNFIGRDKSHP